MNKMFFGLVLLLVLLSTAATQATIWTYSGLGNITDMDGGVHNLYTELTVSDQIRDYSGINWATGEEGSILDPSSVISKQIYFNVDAFRIEITGFKTFYGEGLQLFGWIDNGNIFTDEWQLSAQIGEQSIGLFFDGTFPHYDYDGTLWEFRTPGSDHYGLLGPVIDVGPALSISDEGQFGRFGSFNPINLSITREQGGASPPAPVPEPTTMVLVGIGLICVLGTQKRRMRA